MLLAKGNSLMLLGEFAEAETALEQYVLESHGNPAGMLAYARSLLYQGKSIQAKRVLENFPPSGESAQADLLLPVASFLPEELDEIVFDDPLEAAFRNAIRMAKRGNILIALDGLLGVLKKDKHYRGDQVKSIYLGLLEVLSDDHPDVRQYRSDLSSALF